MQAAKVRPSMRENEFALLVQISVSLPLYVVDSLLAPGIISTMLLMTKRQVKFYYFLCSLTHHHSLCWEWWLSILNEAIHFN